MGSKSDNKESKGAEISDAARTSPLASDSGTALYYELVAESLGQHKAIPNSPGDVFFAVQEGAEIPAEVIEIQGRIEHTAYALRQLYESTQPEKYRRLFEELLSAAKVLAGPKPNPVVVAGAIERLQEKILSTEGTVIKGRYLNALGKRILIAIVVIGLLVLASQLPIFGKFASQSQLTTLSYYGLMFSVASLAMWLSFASRIPNISFEDLLNPDGDMLGARHRIIYVLMFTAVLALFAEAEFIGTISIGLFSTAKISTEYVSAAIFGFACGFSEKLLASTVAPHVTKIIGGLGRTK